MALFLLDCTESVLCGALTLGLMPPKIHRVGQDLKIVWSKPTELRIVETNT